MSRFWLAVPLVAVSLTAAACGGPGTTNTSSTATTESAAAAASSSCSTIVTAAASKLAAVTSASSGSSSGGSGGTPPSGGPPGQGGGGGGSSTQTHTSTGAFTLSSGMTSTTGKTYTASSSDESAIYVTNNAQLTLTNPTITTSGNSESSDESSFYGLNAAVLAQSGGKITMTGGSISTTGSGANGLDANGTNSAIIYSDGSIKATGEFAHGVLVSKSGTLTLNNVNATTTGTHGSVIATDRGGGTVTVNGGTMSAAGAYSAVVYSTGDMTLNKITGTATAADGVVVEGHNSICLNDSDITGSTDGALLYQSFSGDAGEGTADLLVNGGSLTATNGPAFVNQTTAAEVVVKNGAKITSKTGQLISVSKSGTLSFTADGETLTGTVTVDSTGKAVLALTNGTTLTSTVTGAGIALDRTSSWKVTGDSTVTTLVGALISGSSITNITGNGHTVYYDKSLSANNYLGGGAYTLAGGGQLVAK